MAIDQPPSYTTKNRMFESFHVRHFRCFEDLSLDGLKRVNLIAGKNNVGKTALLEAIFIQLAPGNPSLPTRLHAFRGVERTILEPDEVWGWLFSQRETNEPIQLEATLAGGGWRKLKLSLTAKDVVRATANADSALTTEPSEGSPRDLVLTFTDSEGQSGEATASIATDGEIKMRSAQLPPLPGGVFVFSYRRSSIEDAERFSRLEEVGREDEIVPVLRLLEPRFKRLVVTVMGGAPVLKADVGMGRLVPLQLMGEGVARLLSYVLAIASVPNGVVLIDEVENGLHHSVLQQVWRLLAEAARRLNVQVFATTHSWENISAAHRALSESLEYDLRLVRLDRRRDGIHAVSYDSDSLEAATKAELEVR